MMKKRLSESSIIRLVGIGDTTVGKIISAATDHGVSLWARTLRTIKLRTGYK